MLAELLLSHKAPSNGNQANPGARCKSTYTENRQESDAVHSDDIHSLAFVVLHGESSKRLAPPRNTKDRRPQLP